MCCDSSGHKQSDTTERLKCGNENNHLFHIYKGSTMCQALF